MALSLVEAAKLRSNNGEEFRAAIIEMYASSSDLLNALPFETIQGNALRYNREDVLPGVGFRGVNESYTESTGVVNPLTEPLAIAGGDLDVDTFIVTTMGADQRSIHESMKIKSLAHAWTKTFIKGDSSSEPREFDGLQVRLTGNQLIDAGTTSGGDALSLAKLDELLDLVMSPTHLIMNKGMRRRLTQAARSTSVGGFITYAQDNFGRRQEIYNGVPILIADEDNAGNKILPFTEASPVGAVAATTSIYAVSLAEGMLTGIQSGDIDARDLGEQQSKPAFRTRVEWYAGIACFHGKAAARLRGIKDVAVVA